MNDSRRRSAFPRAVLACGLLGPCMVSGCLEPEPRRTITPYEGDPAPGLRIGELRDGVFVEYADGDAAAWVWGGQGGAMITPVLVVAPEIAGGERFVQVTLANLPDPDVAGSGVAIEFRELDTMVDLIDAGGLLRTPTLPDQLSWGDPRDTRLRLEASVTGEAFASSGAVTLRVANEDAPNSCAGLPTEGDGCVYRILEGTAWVSSVSGSSQDLGCADPTAIEIEFWPVDDAMSHCSGDDWGLLQLPDGRDLPQACLAGLGLENGAEIAVTQKTLVAGTCTPLIWEFDLDLAACAALCVD